MSATVAAAATAGGALLVLVLIDSRSHSTSSELPLPVSPRPAFTIPAPAPLADGVHVSRWADVLRPVTARLRPSRSAPGVVGLPTRTPEGTANIVVAHGSTSDAAGRLWVRVSLPGFASRTTGWVPRSALGGYTLVRTSLLVDLSRLTARLLRDGREIFRAPVGVGQPRWPTPVGRFYVRDRLTRYRSAFYGPIAFGTSARSAVLTDWPAGGFIGIHGTDRPELLPGRVSHGCIRMRNQDIVKLDRLMPVGTPLTIVA